MAKGLNSLFLASPQRFMATHTINTPQGIGNIKSTSLPRSGVGEFDLFARMGGTGLGGAGAVELRTYTDTLMRHGNKIHAFLLNALPNQDNKETLPVTVRIMLTNLLNGCQFMAYGPDRKHLTVEHNNYFGDRGQYSTHYNKIQGQPHAIFCALKPVMETTTTAGDEYAVAGMANIVGVRADDGWHFFVRAPTFGVANIREL